MYVQQLISKILLPYKPKTMNLCINSKRKRNDRRLYYIPNNEFDYFFIIAFALYIFTEFEILSPPWLNLYRWKPDHKIVSIFFQNPVSLSDDKTLCCCCCTSDPITMDVHLEKEAFVVGEVANVKVHITNMSNDSIESVNLILEMVSWSTYLDLTLDV